MKKRILVCSEFSGVSSGVGTVQRELVKRFHAKGLEVAELAGGVAMGDPALQSVPWKVYPVVPNPSNEEAIRVFQSDPHNMSGRYLFEQVLLDYKPTHVAVSSDSWLYLPWMTLSPFRRFFSLIHQASVDGAPQNADWLAWCDMCDRILTYTDWGAKILGEALPRRAVVPAHLCSDAEVLKPLPKGAVRNKLGVQDDAIIIGMTSRNQPRKDFDSLMMIFRRFLNEAHEDISRRSYLYLHTSFPDQSWKIEEMLHDHGLSSKVLFTYKCANCQSYYPAFFQDARAICRKCGAPALQMTSVHNGINREQLCEIYNLWDICLHTAFLGGCEFGILESIFCGVPALYTHYSGMEDFKDTADAIPVNVAAFRREPESGRYWAIVDQDDAVAKLIKYTSMPSQMRNSLGARMRAKAVGFYNWDKSAQIWMDQFEDTAPALPWDAPPLLYEPHQPPQDLAKLAPSEIVNWIITHVGGEPELVNSRLASQMIYNLTNGFVAQGIQKMPYGINNVVKYFLDRRGFINHWERMRKNG